MLRVGSYTPSEPTMQTGLDDGPSSVSVSRRPVHDGSGYGQRAILRAGGVPSSLADVSPDERALVRIHALGAFEILLSGAPLDAGTLRRNRPLELLKALIALGSSKVAQERIAGAVWPDSSGDRAISALHTTLHRLRKLLRRENAVLLKDGQLSLNEHIVWVDVWAIQALLDQLERALTDHHIERSSLLALERRTVGFYKGHFLERDAERPWTLRLRHELQRRTVRACVAVGARAHEAGDREAALEAYEGALRIDPLSERLHRQLMRVHADNGDFAEALRVYERCKQTLSVDFGVLPGTATAQLYEAIRGRAARPVA